MMEKISVEEDEEEEEEGGLLACLPACLQLASTTDHKTVIKFRLLALICPVLRSVSTATKHQQQHPGPKQVFFGGGVYMRAIYNSQKAKLRN